MSVVFSLTHIKTNRRFFFLINPNHKKTNTNTSTQRRTNSNRYDVDSDFLFGFQIPERINDNRILGESQRLKALVFAPKKIKTWFVLIQQTTVIGFTVRSCECITQSCIDVGIKRHKWNRISYAHSAKSVQ